MSLRLEGLVLRKKILRDSDLMLQVFSQSEGRIWLVRERALKKPQAGLDLFCQNEFIVAQARDFTPIYQTSNLALFSNIRRDYARLQAAAQAVKTVEKITSSLQPNPGLYRLLLNYLQDLNSLAAPELDNIKSDWHRAVLQNEGLYRGQAVTEENFQRQIAAYRG
ncbi:MAG: DNA repair protein RecO [Candidatus Margulisbacteria bacterium]|jgi:DNA repair protein RecO|nr:DNA repair protein RecO [Candidatus Margulisiibacteriota bacterium]